MSAYRGAVVDGHTFVPDVVAKGAKVIVAEEQVEAPEQVTVIQVEDTRYALACISAAYFGHPARKLKTIGITGDQGQDHNHLYGEIHIWRMRVTVWA